MQMKEDLKGKVNLLMQAGGLKTIDISQLVGPPLLALCPPTLSQTGVVAEYSDYDDAPAHIVYMGDDTGCTM